MAQRGNYLPHFDICPEFKGDLIEDNFRMNIYIYIFIIVSDREQNHLPGALEDVDYWVSEVPGNVQALRLPGDRMVYQPFGENPTLWRRW